MQHIRHVPRDEPEPEVWSPWLCMLTLVGIIGLVVVIALVLRLNRAAQAETAVSASHKIVGSANVSGSRYVQLTCGRKREKRRLETRRATWIEDAALWLGER